MMQTHFDRSCTTITFDFWNTLVAERPGYTKMLRLDALMLVLDNAGVEIDPTRLEIALDSALSAHRSSWHSNRQFLASDGVEHVIKKLEVEVSRSVYADLEAAFELEGVDLELSLAPGIEGTLDQLYSEGVAIGVVSDVGFISSRRLRAFLDRKGLLDYFRSLAFSDEVGHYKPSPTIFEHAMLGLDASPESAMHVGDLRRTDVAGAREFGMRAVRYKGINDDQSEDYPEADFVISEHCELLGILKI